MPGSSPGAEGTQRNWGTFCKNLFKEWHLKNKAKVWSGVCDSGRAVFLEATAGLVLRGRSSHWLLWSYLRSDRNSSRADMLFLWLERLQLPKWRS